MVCDKKYLSFHPGETLTNKSFKCKISQITRTETVDGGVL